MIAVVVVRDGVLPAGAAETAAEAGGRALLAGSGTGAARASLGPLVGYGGLACWEVGPFRPGAWSRALASVLGDERVVVLPASPDGRDLAPRLSLALGRPLYAAAIAVREDGATVVRGGGLALAEVVFDGPSVATLVPGSRGLESPPPSGPDPGALGGVPTPPPAPAPAPGPAGGPSTGRPAWGRDARTLEVRECDPAHADLAEAGRIVAGGAGVGSAEAMARLGDAAAVLGCALGGTRVVTDARWLPVARQIGTTGVVVAPDLYIAVGISGAVQHTAGIGDPRHVVAVNTDPSCPMMARADLALVTDAPGFVEALAAAVLGGPTPPSPSSGVDPAPAPRWTSGSDPDPSFDAGEAGR